MASSKYDWDMIRNLYESTDITMKAIADKLNIPDSTVRAKRLLDTKSGSPWVKKDSAEASVQRINELLIDEESEYDLSEKERLFCYFFAESLNATAAYAKAFKVKRTTARVGGSKLLKQDGVRRLINDLKEEKLRQLEFTANDVLDMYKKIAFSDITDFIDMEQVEAMAKTTIISENGEKEVKETPYTYSKFTIKDGENLDGTIVTEISRGKDGQFKVQLADKMKALEFLARYTDLLSEKEMREFNKQQAKASIRKMNADADVSEARAAQIKSGQKDTSLLDALTDVLSNHHKEEE